jgi:hypothetical protein
VVEVIRQLLLGRFVPLWLLALVSVVQDGIGRRTTRGGIFDVHVDDLYRILFDVRNSGLLELVLVCQEDIWCCQGRLIVVVSYSQFNSRWGREV